MKRIHLKRSQVVLVDRHQRGELNDALRNNWFESKVCEVDWSTDSGTMVVNVGYNPDPNAYEPVYTVFHDRNGTAYYEVPTDDDYNPYYDESV